MKILETDTLINFGGLPRIPDGYGVVKCSVDEMYYAVGPDDWRSKPTDQKFWAFELAMHRAKLESL